jgi:uncharacterized protein involved in exopolysaccharide biosynthesis
MDEGHKSRSRRELARVIFSRLGGMLAIIVVTLLAVMAVSYFSPWKYRSQAMLLASPTTVTTEIEARATLRERLSLFVMTQRELLKSDYVLAAALMRLDGLPAEGPDVDGVRRYTDEQVERFIAARPGRIDRARRAVSVTTPGGADVTFTQTFKVTVERAERRGRLSWPSLRSRSAAARRAHDFAAYVLEAYNYRRGLLESRRTGRSAEFLRDTATVEAREDADEAAAALEKYIADELGGDLLVVESMLSGISETGSQSLRTRFQAEINTLSARIAELKALLAAVQVELEKPEGEQVVVPEAIRMANPSIGKLTDAISDLRIRLNALRPRYTEEYADVSRTRQELEANLADLRDELARQSRVLMQEQAGLVGRRDELRRVVDADEQRIDELAGKAARYRRLKQDFEGAQAIYTRRQEEAAAAAKAAAAARQPMEVLAVDSPSLPDVDNPYRPILWLNFLVALVAGLVLALSYAFVADHLDHSVKGNEDVERAVGVPVLGSVPKLSGGGPTAR